MRADIVNLRQFYSSRLGRQVKSCLRRVVFRHWPIDSGKIILGMGYTTPIFSAIDRHQGKTPLLMALMPRTQGAIYWPINAENRSVLGDVMRPPIAAGSVPRMLLMHVFEHSAQPEALLDICWELLSPGGQLLLVVPNRRGVWARFGATPFATGAPSALAEIKQRLSAADFTLMEVSSALFAPPSEHPIWLRSSWLLEWLGRMIFPRSGGVLIVEAEKQIYAGVGERIRTPAKNWQVQPGMLQPNT